MLKIRRSRDRLIFNMGIPIPRKALYWGSALCGSPAWQTLQSPILATVNYWHLQTYPGTWASQFASTIQFAGFVIREFGYLKAKAVSPALAVWTEINGRGTQRMCSFSAIGFGWIVLNNLGVVCLEMCIVPWWFRLDTGPQGGPYMGCSLGCCIIISKGYSTLVIVGWYWIADWCCSPQILLV